MAEDAKSDEIEITPAVVEALREVVGEWITDNRAELDDGGSGDVARLARRIWHLGRNPPGPSA